MDILASANEGCRFEQTACALEVDCAALRVAPTGFVMLDQIKATDELNGAVPAGMFIPARSANVLFVLAGGDPGRERIYKLVSVSIFDICITFRAMNYGTCIARAVVRT